MFRQIRPVGNKITFSNKATTSFFPDYHFAGYGSGTQALAAALLAAKALKSSVQSPKALLPAYACPDLISACVFAGVQPVLIDLSPDSPWMDLNLIQTQLDERVIAIVAVNFLGIPERMEALKPLALKHAAVLIEDSAQSLPKSGSDAVFQGDIIICSFGRGKPLSLLEGGGILCKSEKIKLALPPSDNQTDTETTLSSLKYRFKAHIFNYLSRPFPFYLLNKLPFIHFGGTRYKKLEGLTALPFPVKNIIHFNYHAFSKNVQRNQAIFDLLYPFHNKQLVDLVRKSSHPLHHFLLRYPLLINDPATRNDILEASNQAGLGLTAMYQTTLPNIENIPDIPSDSNNEYPNAEHFASRLLTIPTHSDMRIKDIKTLSSILNKYL